MAAAALPGSGGAEGAATGCHTVVHDAGRGPTERGLPRKDNYQRDKRPAGEGGGLEAEKGGMMSAGVGVGSDGYGHNGVHERR